jgi:hypothetical protein
LRTSLAAGFGTGNHQPLGCGKEREMINQEIAKDARVVAAAKRLNKGYNAIRQGWIASYQGAVVVTEANVLLVGVEPAGDEWTVRLRGFLEIYDLNEIAAAVGANDAAYVKSWGTEERRYEDMNTNCIRYVNAEYHLNLTDLQIVLLALIPEVVRHAHCATTEVLLGKDVSGYVKYVASMSEHLCGDVMHYLTAQNLRVALKKLQIKPLVCS